MHKLPTTSYHLDNENLSKKVFDARLPLKNATSLLYFKKKGMVQNLIHNLMYKKQEDVGTFLGTWLGEELKSYPGFKEIECVVPVLLYRRKLNQRGFGQELAKKLGAKFIEKLLIKKSSSRTQTFKNGVDGGTLLMPIL
ncbi:hypothetical protein SAMN05660903_00086 [Salegentibacter salinarum]|uniref:ComF family protein n=1 Tax=Salegentibacter salinarum TaxID=447422 RepID=UPI0009D541E5|nr:hypothetical protein [Salegentibacter salinarum]SKB32856.1 hypothetical protein SAMN05660903_00086 [Salegentibacter salinarum]